MPATTSAKGNPASHRMSNAAYKDRRSRSWRNGQRRKAERIAAQRERERTNRERQARGEPTPWQVACAKRWTRRRLAAPTIEENTTRGDTTP